MQVENWSTYFQLSRMWNFQFYLEAKSGDNPQKQQKEIDKMFIIVDALSMWRGDSFLAQVIIDHTHTI